MEPTATVAENSLSAKLPFQRHSLGLSVVDRRVGERGAGERKKIDPSAHGPRDVATEDKTKRLGTR